MSPQSPRAPSDGVWQPVAGTWYKFFVFSAFKETRQEAAVRIVAVTKNGKWDPVFCRLWLNDTRTFTLKARVQLIREHHRLRYSAVFVLCLLNDTNVTPKETVGAAVAVIASAAPTHPPTNLLTVLDTEPRSDIEASVHMCVQPFHSAYNSYDWMIEWIELQTLLGVDHMYMYNSSLGKATSCLINHYKRLGFVTVLPWKLSFPSKDEIHVNGQLASLNDCLYRSMQKASWLLVMDVDEAVLPRIPVRTISEMLSNLTANYLQQHSKHPVALIFKNTFFYMRWKDDPKAPAPLITARKTMRRQQLLPYFTRSKYVVRPRDAIELGIHFIWERARGSYPIAGVRPENAMLHHYRKDCENNRYKFPDECLLAPSVVDRTAHRWSKQLMKKVTERKKLLAKACWLA